MLIISLSTGGMTGCCPILGGEALSGQEAGLTIEEAKMPFRANSIPEIPVWLFVLFHAEEQSRGEFFFGDIYGNRFYVITFDIPKGKPFNFY